MASKPTSVSPKHGIDADAGADEAQKKIKVDEAEAADNKFELLHKGWFSEINSQWPGIAMSFKVDQVLWDKQSQYQHVQVFKTPALGTVLVLDGVIQITERDECAYQEMISHIPLFAHPNPERVLIVGGGDGGCVREALRHPSVKQVVICEIDQMVMDVAKQFLPTISCGYSDPRVTILCQDAALFMQQEENVNRFDVIIVDSSDPVGPAEPLFGAEFYGRMHAALRPGGKICTQAESYWLHLSLIEKMMERVSPIFDAVEYATTQIPTYPCGQIGFLLCNKAGPDDSKDSAPTCSKPVRSPSDEMQKALRFYSSALHSAAFVLPQFAQRVIYARKPSTAST